ncbi:alkaline phosphatase D family protein [Corynebacterium lactis]|uniref:alkaline phosphatase D family protein n=1 Tax=Corynebacterium lactis TaxID=1231000 RepID=UPI003CCBB282
MPNVVWLTADVHYTAAYHYSPERAQFTDFAPFWEFVSAPPSRRGTRPERDGFHIRSERRIRPRSGQGQCRSGPHSGFPALRRGQHRRRQPGDDGTAADHTRHGAVVDHLAATVVLQDSLPPPACRVV